MTMNREGVDDFEIVIINGISVNTSMIEEDVIRMNMGLKPKEQDVKK